MSPTTQGPCAASPPLNKTFGRRPCATPQACSLLPHFLPMLLGTRDMILACAGNITPPFEKRSPGAESRP